MEPALTVRTSVVGDARRIEYALRNTGTDPIELSGLPMLELDLEPPVELSWVRPFSWDNDAGAFTTCTEVVRRHRGLISGPYGALDCRRRNRGEATRPAPVAERAGIGHYLPPPEPDELAGPYRETCGWLALTHAGETLVCAWEWSGTVLADVTEGTLSVRLAHDRFVLEPGATVTAPAVVLLRCHGGLEEAGHALRRLIEDAYLPAPRLAVPPVVADSWGLGEAIDEERVLRLIDDAASLGAEAFTLDKGWERAVGDWHANDRFPAGLRALADHARRRGLSFGLWVAFGNADPASPVVRQHPDWVAELGGERLTWSFGNHALCLAHEPAGAWVRAELDRIVREHGVQWLLHDFETLARCDAAHHTHAPGAGEHANVAALYAILDDLRRDHPALVVENCWNGGRMMDLAMLRRHDVGIGDDWARAEPNRLAVYGMTRFLPPGWCTRYMGDEALPPRYLVRSYLLGGPWVLMGDWPRWPEAMRAEARAGIALFKRLRGRLARSRVLHLREPGSGGWDAVQALDEAGDSVLLAFGAAARVALRGLDPGARYRVRYEDRGDELFATGAALVEDGIPVPGLDGPFGTELAYVDRL